MRTMTVIKKYGAIALLIGVVNFAGYLGAMMKSDKAFIKAVQDNDAEAVEKMLGEGANPNAKYVKVEGHYRSSPLPVLFHATGAAVAELLLKSGAKVNAKDEAGQTVAFYANVEVLSVLIAHGANVNARAERGETPLFDADVDKSRILIANKAEVNAVDFRKEHTPLFGANAEKTRLLLDHGADATKIDEWGKSPLFYLKDVEVAELLLDHGAGVGLNVCVKGDPRDKGIRLTPLGYYCDILVNFNARNAEYYGIRDADSVMEIIKFLIARGADLNARCKGKGERVLNIVEQLFQDLLETKKEGNEEKWERYKNLIVYLISKGASISPEYRTYASSRFPAYLLVAQELWQALRDRRLLRQELDKVLPPASVIEIVDEYIQ